MAMIKEFREFASRGNVVDLAVGVILGAAFGKIVTSFVNDIVMPPIGMVIGRIDFKSLFVSLNGQQYASLADAQKAAALAKYGEGLAKLTKEYTQFQIDLVKAFVSFDEWATNLDKSMRELGNRTMLIAHSRRRGVRGPRSAIRMRALLFTD